MPRTTEVVRQLLIDLGIGNPMGNPDWPVYTNTMPDSPDNVLLVMHAAGFYEFKDMRGNEANHPGFQLTARAKSQKTAMVKMDEVIDAFRQVNWRVVELDDETAYKIQNITRESDPMPIGKERDPQTFREGRRDLVEFYGRLTMEEVE